MSVNFIYSGIDKRRVSLGKNINDSIKRLIKIENKKLGVINLIFTDNVGILDINKKFLKHNYFTDVITFNENKRDTLNGDIFISIDQVIKNALELNENFDKELLRIIVHGVLHLIGYDDKTDEEKKVMRNIEDTYLCMFMNM